ncbi:PQQ-binding-like beta-propeller repeat protein [Actinoplanes utahensis]|uniref:outer membrane protein assembly factor BamB family protein n=1 Tax=Actinoplanes utahensis TaxID=1869 RepID=UPI000A80A09B|nr:hypothetical protein Aut01nite_42750 [Actinoplanes utahensis]
MDGRGFGPQLHEVGPNLALSLGGVWTSLLDPATGTELWNDHEYPGAILAGDLIVLWKDGGTGGGRLGVLDPRTARPVWWHAARSVPIAATATGRHVQVISQDGTAVVHARDTGAKVLEVGGIPVGDGFDGRPVLSVAGDLAFVFGRGNVTALRLPMLDRLWTTRMGDATEVNRCGTRLCVTGSAGLTALDQQNGNVVWSGPAWVAWHNGLAASRSGQVAPLDPETGAVTGPEMSGWLAGGLLLRRSGEEHYVIDTVTGRIRGWQRAAGGWLRCTSTGTHLACPAGGDSVTVWRLS